MSFYSVEQWTIKQVAVAFHQKSKDKTDRRIVIPIFQRGLRWEPKKRAEFIDSLDKGYPFGCLLFAKHPEPNTYSVVDGLQRSSTVCDFVYNPLNKYNFRDIDNDTLSEIRLVLFPGSINETINERISDIIKSYLDECKTFDNIDILKLAKKILNDIQTQEDKFECVERINDIIRPVINSRKSDYDKICSAIVPIVVYSGPNELLSDIFRRINKNGIPLNDYEIYSAIWSQDKKVVNNNKIVQKVVNKYISLTSKFYIIDGFDANEMLNSKKLTAFEYLFGLGKYWSETFDCLKLQNKKDDDIVNEIGFEIVDACISDSKDIANLDKKIYKYNINKLQKKIEEAIVFVSEAIASISQFKGNKRKTTVLHSKYQIVSLVSFMFKQMFDKNNLSKYRDSWERICKDYKKNLLAHYVIDIISNEWHDGGGSKVYSAINNKKYLEKISKERISTLLSGYYQTQLSNKQAERFSNPTNADSVILNCIYVNLFTANDQLSAQKFDIEHLATKERMKKIIRLFPNLTLPVTCIANLCYLPESVNRGKCEKTIYEATNLSLPLAEIENKYSFTKREDLAWITKDYSVLSEDEFKNDYYSFLKSRYSIIEKKLLEVFGY